MSRNLCRSDCRHCGHELTLDEAPRPITIADCGKNSFPEYEGMVVANASCPLCGAQYLAWLDGTRRKGRGRYGWDWIDRPHPQRDESGNLMIADLSYRSTFSNEPGVTDLPKFEPVAEMKRLRAENAELVAQLKENLEAMRELKAAAEGLVADVKQRDEHLKGALDLADRLSALATKSIDLAKTPTFGFLDTRKGEPHG